MVDSGYVFNFDKILADKDSFNLFFKFNEREYNAEKMFFLQEVLELEHMPFNSETCKTAVQLANHIFSTYIEAQCSQCTAKKELTTVYRKYKQSEEHAKWLLVDIYATPADAFTKSKNMTLFELKSDAFPRFLRSKAFQTMLHQRGSVYMKEFAVPKASTVYNYTDADFADDCVISDVDFNFWDLIALDNFDWELQEHAKVGDTGYISAYYSDKVYMPNVSWAQAGSCMKFVGMLPYPMEMVATALNSQEALFCIEKYTEKATTLQYLNNQELQAKFPDRVKHKYRGMGICENIIQCPFPINQKRRFINCASSLYEEQFDRVTMIQKCCTIKDRPLPNKKWIDAKTFSMFQFTSLAGNRTLFTQAVMFNVLGWSTKTLNKLSVAIRAKDQFKQLSHFLKEEQEGKHSHFKRDDCLAKCIKENDISNRKVIKDA